MQDVIIIGSGGVGQYVLQAIRDINKLNRLWNILGFVDQNSSMRDSEINGAPVLGGVECLKNYSNISVVIAFADPVSKLKMYEMLKDNNHTEFPSIIHPRSWIAENVSIGMGSIIYPGVSINVNGKIGRFVTINMNSAIGHDTIIDSHVTIAPNVGIGGNVKINDKCNIGIGASIIQGITIGRNTIIGAGAVVINDIPEGVTAVGVPAKPIK